MKNKFALISFLMSVLLAGLIIFYFSKSTLNPEEFALGEETKSYFANANNYSIHINRFSKEEIHEIKKGWIENGKKPVVLILGNSQTHGINQMKANESNYVEMLHHQLNDQYYVIGHSLPNANLQEFMLSFNYLKQTFPIKKLIIPVFFDDLREDGIRDVFFPLFNSDSFNLTSDCAIATKINHIIASFRQTASNENNFEALAKTTQEKTENYLEGVLSQHWKIWEARPNMRGEFFVFLYTLRNSLLGINAQSIRKSIPLRTIANLDALECVLKEAQNNNIEALVYIPPIRNDVQLPYDLSEYEQFKLKINQLTQKYPNLHTSSFENLVPGKYWGMKASTNMGGKPEYDFMHFQFRGHQLLDSVLLEQFTKEK